MNDKTHYYLVFTLQRWSEIRGTAGIYEASIGPPDGNKNNIGFLPVFDNREEAMTYAKGKEHLIEEIRICEN